MLARDYVRGLKPKYMPQSLANVYIHLVFSTKHRQPFIQPEIEDKLYGYISGIGRNLDCPVLQIGGIEDHIHILLVLSMKITLADIVEDIKKNSSKWIKTQGDCDYFYWQNGYGAFSVSPRHVDRVKRYIANQKEHHRTKSFMSEYVGILKQYNITYDEKYVWD